MSSALHNPPDGFQRVLTWYQKAQIDYSMHFIALYTAYNSWYREVTSTSNDRVALGMLKKRFVIWDDYRNGKTLRQIRPYMERLCELTQREPLPCSGRYWSGEVGDIYDWRALIEYWYQVRCLVVHGATIRQKYVWLAYETLDIFMNEIIERMHTCLKSPAFTEVQNIASHTKKTDRHSQRFAELQNRLYQKYSALPDIWQVDMQRAESP